MTSIHFTKFGYEYTKEEPKECFENLILICDGYELSWITISDRVMNRLEKYFTDEGFVFGYYLRKKEGYNMKFITSITYENILEDIQTSGLELELKFDKEKYDKMRKLKIKATTFEEAVEKLKSLLGELLVEKC